MERTSEITDGGAAMTALDEAWWARARRARQQLVARFLHDPAIRVIDIGLDPQEVSDTPVLRVHIDRGQPAPLDLPSAVDGIPVRAIEGDYHVEGDSAGV
jgi:hypothetical protein